MLKSKGSVQGPLAQLAEQLTFNQLVAGSSPARLTKVTPLYHLLLNNLIQNMHCLQHNRKLES